MSRSSPPPRARQQISLTSLRPNLEARYRLIRLRAVAVLVFMLGSLVATWPLVKHLDSRIPLGSEPSPTVPYFNLWTLGWTSTWLLQREGSYWDAPIFYPVAGAFALSDPQPLSGLVATPLWPVNRAVSYNVVLLGFQFLNGLLAFRLLRNRGLSATIAMLGGILVQWLPFTTHERGVLQLQPLFGIIWVIDALWRLIDRPGRAAAAELALALVITCLTSEHYAIFLTVVLVAAATVRWSGLGSRGTLGGLGASLAAAGLLVSAVLLPQIRHLSRMGFERSVRTIESHSARRADYLKRSELTLGARLLSTEERPATSHPLAAGFVLAALALGGSAAGLRSSVDRRWTGFLLLLVVLAFLGSLGPNLTFGGLTPYELLRRLVPGFSNLRSPFRLGVLVQLGLALLASLALQRLWQVRRHRLAGTAFAIAVLEVCPLPARLVPLPEAFSEDDLRSPVVFLPYASGSSSAAYAETTAVMVALLPSGAELVNGYSGYFPELNRQLKKLLADFPSSDGLRAIRGLGARTLLIETTRLQPDQRHRLAALLHSGEIAEVGSFWELQAYELQDGPLRSIADYKGRWKLSVTVTAGELVLRASPLELESTCYVVAPRTEPTVWLVRIISPEGVVRERPAEPNGGFLLCEGYVPRDVILRVLRPRTVGTHRIELLAEPDYRVAAAALVTLP